jgi:hypothetical protein
MWALLPSDGPRARNAARPKADARCGASPAQTCQNPLSKAASISQRVRRSAGMRSIRRRIAPLRNSAATAAFLLL